MPIHVVPVGDARVAGDVAVQDIDAPREARPGRACRFGSRCAAGVTPVSVPRSPSASAADPKADPLATLPITLVDGEQAHELVVETDRAKGALTAQVDAAAARGHRRQ